MAKSILVMYFVRDGIFNLAAPTYERSYICATNYEDLVKIVEAWIFGDMNWEPGSYFLNLQEVPDEGDQYWFDGILKESPKLTLVQ